MQTNNKLREAMIEVLEYIESFHKYITPGEGRELTALFAVADTIRAKARAALAEPPRQCDVGTPDEQVERWNNESLYPYEWDDRQYLDAQEVLKWAQMPYEEGGAE